MRRIHHRAVLDSEAVIAIYKAYYDDGIAIQALADANGVHYHTVRNIVNHVSWTKVTLGAGQGYRGAKIDPYLEYDAVRAVNHMVIVQSLNMNWMTRNRQLELQIQDIISWDIESEGPDEEPRAYVFVATHERIHCVRVRKDMWLAAMVKAQLFYDKYKTDLDARDAAEKQELTDEDKERILKEAKAALASFQPS